MEWIPVRTDLHQTREVLAIAELTNRSNYEISGFLIAFWGWAQDQSTDGNLPGISLKSLPRVIGGNLKLWRAIRDQGWLEEVEDGIVIPRFERWLSRGAKKRIADAERKRSEREAERRAENERTKVGQKADKKRDEDRTDPRLHNITCHETSNLESPTSGVMFEVPTLSSGNSTVGVFAENPEQKPSSPTSGGHERGAVVQNGTGPGPPKSGGHLGKKAGSPEGGKHGKKSGSTDPPISGGYSKAENSAPSREAQIWQVFVYWQDTCGHPKATLGPKRHRAIEARLKHGYSVERLCLAVDGCRGSPMHQGANDRNTVYDDIELICRDETKCDRFIELAEATRAVKAKPDHIERHRGSYEEFCRKADAREAAARNGNGNGDVNGARPDAPADPGRGGTGDLRRDPARTAVPGRSDREGPEDG